jgi:F-type H+-transporting ATPase subunit b
MDLAGLHNVLVLAAEGGGGGGSEEESGNFLVTPGVGLMIWTLIAFGITYLILRKLAFPRIQEALDRRANAIEESIRHAAETREQADELLAEYRERLQEARVQAEEIVARARKAAENAERESVEQSREKREELMAQTRRDIEAEARRALQEIRREVADMTVLATEKVTRKTLSPDDQRKLVEEALGELDFSALSGGPNGERSGSGKEG